MRARNAALRPSGPMSTKYLSKHLTMAIVGNSVFVHGGLLVHHVKYRLERMNKGVREWIARQSKSSTPRFLHMSCNAFGLTPKPAAPSFCKGSNSVVLMRKFSEEDCDCGLYEEILRGRLRLFSSRTCSCNNSQSEEDGNGAYSSVRWDQWDLRE
ncbi:Shewanella-like protein phosphatase 2 [Linum perenne]